MSTDNEKRDLPVLRKEYQDLPVLIAGSRFQHEQAPVSAYPDWFTIASQRHVRGLAVNALKEEVWFATGGGVLQWIPGRKSFTRFGSEHGLPGNSVGAIVIDRANRAWVTHSGCGLSYLDGNTWHSYRQLNDTVVSCLCVSELGHVWAVSEKGVFALVSPDQEPTLQFSPFGEPPRAMTVIDEYDVWVCSARGVFRFEDGGWMRYNTRPDILTLLRQGEYLWLGTLSGLIRIELATGEVYRNNTWPGGEVTALAPATEGIWVASAGEIGQATEAGWTPVSKQRLTTRVTSVAEARENEVWVGTHAGLLYGSTGSLSFHLTDMPPDVIGLPDTKRPPAPLSNMIQALAIQRQDSERLLWIGSASGLFLMNTHTDHWKQFPGIRDIRAIVSDPANERMLVASWGDGFYATHHRSVQKHDTEMSSPLFTVVKGIGTQYWAATLDGLYEGDGHIWRLVLPARKLPQSSWIRVIAQSQPTKVWIGTTRGLYMYNPTTEAFTPIEGIPGTPEIRSLLCKSDEVWVGTDHGLYLGDNNHLKPVPGTQDWVITASLWDDANSVWIGTTKGLFQFIQHDGKWAIKQSFTAQNSGLAADRVTALVLEDGGSGQRKLWIGTPNGLSCYTY